MRNMENFKSIIVEERKKAGLTQEVFAKKLGITPQAVSKWENGVGYPNVMLFPVIADVLDIPIERLFGETRDIRQPVIDTPESYCGLPFVCSQNGRACYSSKTVVRVDKEAAKVFFEDGSEADLREGQTTNCGEGEIRIYEMKEIESEVFCGKEKTATTFDQTYGHFDELELSNARFCQVLVKAVKSKAGKSRVEAKGAPEFIAALHVAFNGTRLTVNVKGREGSDGHGENNRLTVYTDSETGKYIKVSMVGAGSCTVEPSFDHTELYITGSGNVTAANAVTAKLKITGSGDIKLGTVSGKADIGITGSGDVTLKSAGGANCNITGSGDVDIKNIHGILAVKICGSGDVSCAGEAEELGLHITGSGDFKGGKLTVGNAKITADNNSSVTIARIKGTSIEKIGKNCDLHVGKRG